MCAIIKCVYDLIFYHTEFRALVISMQNASVQNYYLLVNYKC